MLHTGYRGRKAILLLRFFLHSDHIRKSYVNVYKHVYILPHYRFMHLFFFLDFQKQNRSQLSDKITEFFLIEKFRTSDLSLQL